METYERSREREIATVQKAAKDYLSKCKEYERRRRRSHSNRDSDQGKLEESRAESEYVAVISSVNRALDELETKFISLANVRPQVKLIGTRIFKSSKKNAIRMSKMLLGGFRMDKSNVLPHPLPTT